MENQVEEQKVSNTKVDIRLKSDEEMCIEPGKIFHPHKIEKENEEKTLSGKYILI